MASGGERKTGMPSEGSPTVRTVFRVRCWPLRTAPETEGTDEGGGGMARILTLSGNDLNGNNPTGRISASM